MGKKVSFSPQLKEIQTATHSWNSWKPVVRKCYVVRQLMVLRHANQRLRLPLFSLVLKWHRNWLDVPAQFTLQCSLYPSREPGGAKSRTNLGRRLTRWTPGAVGGFLEPTPTHLSTRCPAGFLSLPLLVISRSPAKLLLLIFLLLLPPLSTFNFQCLEASFQPWVIPV